MTVSINPSSASGRVQAPPSKSVAHRALICAALAGESIVKNIEYSEDIMATLDCLKALGADIKMLENSVVFSASNILGIDDNSLLFCRESGSTLRFMIPLCMLTGKKIILNGSKRLLSRPLSVYEEIAEVNGISFQNNGEGITVCGKLSGGKYKIRGDISSQFITGLLFALPLLEMDSTLEITGNFESASYVDITLKVLSDFGINIEKKGDNLFFIKGNQLYKPCKYTVEGDCSNAAFLDAFNLLGGNVSVGGISRATLQGDRVYLDMFKALREGKKQFDLSDCPDLAPVMFAMAAYLGGAEFSGTKRLKIKESDRAECMKQELCKFGIEVLVGENSVTVLSGELKKPDGLLDGHNDHRIVMALSLLCSKVGGSIVGAEAVSKSYPDFFKKISSLGIGLVKNEA